MVLTAPAGDTCRILLLPESQSTRLLLGARARWVGLKRAAAVPTPSRQAEVPLPASVDTQPPGEMSLTRWLPVSPTSTFPLAGSTATPRGLLKVVLMARAPKRAQPGRPPLEAVPFPARVSTAPPRVMRRMAELLASATNSIPEESMAKPAGEKKLARVPTSSASAAAPLPQNVLTTPAALMRRIK